MRNIGGFKVPGPKPITVLDPGAICVLPASLMTHTSRSKLCAFSASFMLQREYKSQWDWQRDNILIK